MFEANENFIFNDYAIDFNSENKTKKLDYKSKKLAKIIKDFKSFLKRKKTRKSLVSYFSI